MNNNRVNFHVIFSDAVPIHDIEENFLHNLFFVNEGNPQNTDDKKKLTIRNLSELGHRLKAEHSDFTGTDIKVGMTNAVVDSSDICTILNKTPSVFKGNYLLGVPSDEDLSAVNWNDQGHNSRKILIQKSDFLFAANPNTIEWASGKKHTTAKEFEDEFKSVKPCLHGSDSHTYSEIGHPCAKRGEQNHNCEDNAQECKLRNSWIKADVSFEGLKQILYEPELRVKIQEDIPSETETYTKISSAIITLSEDLKIRDESKFCFSGKHEIPFSNNLTCIIGGRGSGKSTLAHMICNKSAQSLDLLKKTDSPLSRVCISPSPLPKIAEQTVCDVPSNTEFFFQNSIERYASDVNAMSDLVTHRLVNLSAIDGENLNDLEEKWQEANDYIQELVDAFDELERIIKNIQENNVQIESLKKQTEIISSEEYKTLQSELKKLSQEISALERYQQDYEKAKKQANQLKGVLEELNWSEDQGKTILSEFIKSIETFTGYLEQKHTVYDVANKKKELHLEIKAKQNELEQFLDNKGFEQEGIEELTTANQKISKLTNQNITFEGEMKPYKEIYGHKDSVIENYKNCYIAYKERYEQVCMSFKRKLKVLEFSNKKIDFDFAISEKNMRDTIVSFIKDKLSDESGLMGDAIEKRVFEVVRVEEFIDDINVLRGHILGIDDAAKNTQFLKNLFSNDTFVEKIKLRMIEYYYDIRNIRVKTKYGGNMLKNTSFGERCGIVLAMVIVCGN